mgnify:CR=1 FL=1
MPNPAVIVTAALTVPVLLEFRFRELRRSNRLSLRDAVSGLPNREYFDLSMERAFAAAQRGHPLLLVQFNIDNLGVVNARFGRPSGTAVVQTFAKLLARQTRREDLSVRFDDTRFVALLADTDVAGANVFASRVLEQFRRLLLVQAVGLLRLLALFLVLMHLDQLGNLVSFRTRHSLHLEQCRRQPRQLLYQYLGLVRLD